MKVGHIVMKKWWKCEELKLVLVFWHSSFEFPSLPKVNARCQMPESRCVSNAAQCKKKMSQMNKCLPNAHLTIRIAMDGGTTASDSKAGSPELNWSEEHERKENTGWGKWPSQCCIMYYVHDRGRGRGHCRRNRSSTAFVALDENTVGRVKLIYKVQFCSSHHCTGLKSE